MISERVYAVVVVSAIAGGVFLRWPGGEGGLSTDDYVHHAALDGVGPVKRSPLDLYTLVNGTEEEVRALKDFGSLAWWCHPGIKLAMMRPLSSALVVFDHFVLGASPIGMHVHSMCWWVFLVICVALLLRELVPLQIAATAVVLFVLEEGNGLLVVWAANRCALISLSLGFLGLLAHIRWRRGGNAYARLSSVALFALALAAGEWAFPVICYLLAFELLSAGGKTAERLRALLPVAILAIGFLLAARILGYGTRYSDVYISPIDTPVAFLASGIGRILALAAELAFGLPARWWHFGTPWRDKILSWELFSPPVWRLTPDWMFWHVFFGLAAVVLGLFVIWWSLRGCQARLRKELRWLLAGAGLSLIPMVAPGLASRSVLPAFVGFSAAWSLVLWEGARQLWITARRNPAEPSLIALCAVLAIPGFQAGVASWRSWREPRFFYTLQDAVARWVLGAEVDEGKAAQRDVYVVNTVEGQSVMFAPQLRHFYGRPMPRSWRALSGAPEAHDISRIAENALELRVLGGTLLDSPMENICRPRQYPLRAGDTVLLQGLKVEVLRTLRGKPDILRFTFARSLDDPSYEFLHSTPAALRRFRIPKVGETRRLPKGRPPDPALLERRRKRGRGDRPHDRGDRPRGRGHSSG